ncbi:hypothetical protein PMAYCL1PPCAC_05031, partial [Pristionchus mayeri]
MPRNIRCGFFDYQIAYVVPYVISSIIFAISLLLYLLAPDSAARVIMCIILSVSLLCSVMASIGIYRGPSFLLIPFIFLGSILLTSGIAILILAVIFSIIQNKSMFRFFVDNALDLHLFDPIVLLFSEPQALSDRSSSALNDIFPP